MDMMQKINEQFHADAAKAMAKWLEDNGFAADDEAKSYFTFVYAQPDSYDVKEDLKAAGFKYNPNLLWHIANPPAEYADACIKIALNDVAIISSWGEGQFKREAIRFVIDSINTAYPDNISNSKFVGEVGERLYNISVKIIKKREVMTKYGYTKLIVFEDTEENLYQWWTSAEVSADVDDVVNLTGTVKKHQTYKDIDYTVLTRCKIKAE